MRRPSSPSLRPASNRSSFRRLPMIETKPSRLEPGRVPWGSFRESLMVKARNYASMRVDPLLSQYFMPNQECVRACSSRRSSIWRFRPVACWPALALGRRRTRLAGHAFERDGVDRDIAEARIETLGPLPGRIGVFSEKAIKKPRLCAGIAEKIDPPKADDAGIAGRGVAFESPIGKDPPHLRCRE